MMKRVIVRLALVIGTLGLSSGELAAIDRPDTVFSIFQFPADQIPRVDGDESDWAMVPESYVIGSEQLVEDSGRYPTPSPETLDVRVRVGWVKGLNRLYFLYEAVDDFWDFAGSGLRNDTFEVVVDADLSGGPLIARWHPAKEFISEAEAYESFQSVHAQNYHIFTPAVDKKWCMFWGPAQWAKELPYANAATRYNFKPGEGGRLVLEFWITPFDYAGAEGPGRAVESILRENKLIGLSWAVIDYDTAGEDRRSNGFWNLSRKHTMFGQADELCMFRLMPLEPELRPTFKASWSHQVLDYSARRVAFRDESEGVVTSWAWDFGDGSTSTEQNPIHTYAEPGRYVVVLQAGGPAGQSRLAKVWDVSLWSDTPAAAPAPAQASLAETAKPQTGNMDRGAEAESGDQVYVYKTVNDQDLRLWVRRPAESAPDQRRPAVVFFHGGGWTGGPLFQFSPQSTHFVSRGMVAIQVEYRFAPKDENGGPPLVCIQDAKSAVRWVRSHATELGIDPERIAVGGGSAGGHLAAACSMLEGCNDPQDDLSVSAKGNAQLLFNPVSDLGPDGGYAHDRVGENWRDYSPAHHITAGTPPTIVFLGTKDHHIPVRTMERFTAEMRRAGVRCDTHYYEDRAHGFFNRGDDLADTVKKCDDFLVSLGWLKPVP